MVLSGHGRDGQNGVGHVHAFPVGQAATVHHRGVGEVRAAALDPQPDAAVVEQEVLPRLQHGKDLRVRQVGPLLITLRLIEVETEVVPARQGDPAALETADTQFRALQVHDRADWTPALLLDLAEHCEALGVIFMAAVTEVEAEHVRTGVGQLANPLLGRTCRTQCRDDLGAAVPAHASHSLDAARPFVPQAACRAFVGRTDGSFTKRAQSRARRSPSRDCPSPRTPANPA